MPLRYNITTLGCQMNEADTRHLSSQLEALGYQVADEPDAADLVVVNTCVVRQQAEDRAIGHLARFGRIKRERPDLTIALMGCMVGMREAPSLRRRFPYVDVFMPPSETEPLIEHLAGQGLYDREKLRDVRDKAIRSAIQDEDFVLPALRRGQSVTANVPIVLGCSHACTFCIIPYRRGAERSKPRAEILREVRALAEQGVKEVMLLGQIVDRYGMDLHGEGDLADLLRDVADTEGLERVRFLTSHPSYMGDRIIGAVADHPKICPQFEIPAQAGNNRVLENMRRGYTIEEYEAVVDRIRRRIPDAAIHTDIIVGFCGETEEQYLDTCRHIERIRPDKVHLAKYSVRPKTIAARQMPDDVPPEVKEERRLRLDALHTGILEEKMAALRGRTVSVLVEGREARFGRWQGRTPHAKPVFFEDPRELLGQLVEVVVEEAKPYSLHGTVAALNAPCPVTASGGMGRPSWVRA